MDPFEQRLRDKVVYLHSLWHQGPPPYPRISHHSSSQAIPISNPTLFKKQNSAATKKKKQQHMKRKNGEEPKLPEREWPCKEEPITEPSPAWPAMKQKEPGSGQTSRSVSAEEQAKIAGQVMQQRALERYRRLFGQVGGSDGEEEEDDDDDDDDGDEEEEDAVEGDNGRLEESEEYKFMLDVFVNDSDLREYYERNQESGDFWCFVCGAQGGKMSGRKFKSCYGVLQHSISVSKTKKRRAHRAFGLVICRVMGWDVKRLPLLVANGEPLSRSLAGPGLLQQTVCEEDAATKSVDNYDNGISIPGFNVEGKDDGPTAAKEDDSMSIKNPNGRNIDASADEEKLLQCCVR